MSLNDGTLLKSFLIGIFFVEQDMLRLPVMLVKPDLTKERAQFLPLLDPDLMDGASDMRIEVLVSALDAEQLRDRYTFASCAFLHAL